MNILHPEFLILIPLILFITNKKNFLLAISAISLILSISQIAIKEVKEIKIPNNDIFLIIDTTYSMACKDLKPNRLEYAKNEIIKLIKKVNKPIGLISFDKKVNILTLPTSNKELLIQKIKPLTPKKARTDIQMAINTAKYISSSKKTIVLISDGGEKKVDGNFIFWGFATQKGAKIPGFEAISKLNIIGEKFFSYKDTEKLIKYLNSHTTYSTKQLIIYKPISYIFAILAFISFALYIVFSKFKILILLVFIFPNQVKANDFLGCLYEYLNLKNLAIKEFKNSDTDFAKMKMAIYYLKHNQLKKALNKIDQIKKHPKKNFLKALILTKMHKYKEAFNILKTTPLDKDGIKLYNLLKKQISNNQKSIIYEINISKSNNYKEPLW